MVVILLRLNRFALGWVRNVQRSPLPFFQLSEYCFAERVRTPHPPLTRSPFSHWRRLSITIDLNVLSVCCEESVSISLPQWGKGDHRRWWMRCPPSISPKITSVGDKQTHFGYRKPQQLDRRKAETSRIPLFLCASAQKQGDSNMPRWVRVFAHQKRENPILFGRMPKEPFRKRVPWGCLFCVSSFRLWRKHSAEAEKSTPKAKQLSRNNIQNKPKQKQTFPKKFPKNLKPLSPTSSPSPRSQANGCHPSANRQKPPPSALPCGQPHPPPTLQYAA